MFLRFETWGAQAAEKLRERAIQRLAAQPLPEGVAAEISEEGVILSGKSLRRRMIDNVHIRNFGR